MGHLDCTGVHELLEELGMVLLGHPEQVGDDQHGVGLGVLPDELALAPGVEGSIWSSASRCRTASFSFSRLGVISRIEEPTLGGVLGRIEGGELVAEGKAVPVGLDDLGDVVSLQGHGEPGEGPDGRVAGREGRLVVVDLDGLVVAGHHEDVVERLLYHGTAVAEVGRGTGRDCR